MQKRRVQIACMTAILLFFSTSQGQDETANENELIIPLALASPIQVIDVPATASGTLVTVDVVEGQYVDADLVLAQINDKKARLRLRASEIRLENAERRGKDDVALRYARAAHAVTKKELEINRSLASKNSISQQELERSVLTAKQAELQIEKSQVEQELIQGDIEVEKQNVEAAKLEISRHSIRALFTGNIFKIYRRRGEWVTEGEKIFRFADLSKMRIEGHISGDRHDPADLLENPVTAVVKLAHGNTEVFKGTIVGFVPEQKPGHLYVLRAEVQNRRTGKRWLLQSGAEVELRISLRN